MTQADWASITCQPQQTTFAREWQALTYSGSNQADLQFLVEVVLFGDEVEGHGGSPVIFSAVTFKHAGDCSHGPVGSLGRIIAISWRVRLST